MGRLGTYALALCMLLVTVIGQQPGATAQSQEKELNYITQYTIDGTVNVKFPRVAGLTDQVAVATNPGGSNSSRVGRVYEKKDTVDPFTTSTDLGEADGQSDYASAGIYGSTFDNAFYATWIDQDRDRIYVRRKPLGGNWEDVKNAGSGSFPVFPDVVRSSDGKLFVIYRDNSRWNYRVSSDGGNSWSGGEVSNIAPIAQADIEAGPNGEVVVVHESANGGDIYASFWNGNGFTTERVAGDGGGSRYYTTPTVAIGNDGRIYVAWRTEAGEVYYSERQPDGSWPTSRIASGGRVENGVSIHVDANNNLYLNWISTRSGSPRVYFAFRRAGGDWEGPIESPSPGAMFNGDAGITVTDNGYAHYVAEYFSGVGLRTRYFRFRVTDVGACEAIVAFTGGATQTNSRTITGAVGANAGCTNDRQQVSLNVQDENAPIVSNRPPNDNRFSFTLTDAQLQERCVHTVYARLFNGNTPYAWGSNSILVDAADAPNPVNANVQLRNPFSEPRIGVTNPNAASPQDILNSEDRSSGAWGGDPRFTRNDQAVLSISDAGDCTGLATFTGMTRTNVPIPATGFREQLTLPLGMGLGGPDDSPGLKTFPVTISDKIGNIQTFNLSIVFDPPGTDSARTNNAGRPQVTDEQAIELVPDNSASARLSIIRNLAFRDAQVTDNLYNRQNGVDVPDNGQFWGVWVATEYLGRDGSPTPVGLDSDKLNYYAVPVTSRDCDSSGCDFTIRWNLFQGVENADGTPFGPDLTKHGTYRVYVRFLDGAGNYSTWVGQADFVLDQGYRLPSLFLPTLSR